MADLGRRVAVREIVARNLPATPRYGTLARAGLPTHYKTASERFA